MKIANGALFRTVSEPLDPSMTVGCERVMAPKLLVNFHIFNIKRMEVFDSY